MACRQAEWDKSLESVDQHGAELAHLQWNLIRQQVTSLVRDVNGLKDELSVLSASRESSHAEILEVLSAQKADSAVKAFELADMVAKERLAREEHAHALESTYSKLSADYAAVHAELRNAHKQSRSALEAKIAELVNSHHEHTSNISSNHNALSAAHHELEKSLRHEIAVLHESHQLVHKFVGQRTSELQKKT
eukprot:gnl/TRDRNA2_/TRDRNA2_79531_c0_seq1.p1 gnl/TRDRNA2_/TRDRNA2_79531_c0~~gnl/TRDRNA2_/TRDRNA2_79531_c0_seq1.p1  ORF type:complete len:193 (+),score=35.33 gnl/TRDRNA2_/TRDRNA2_79531_c0_seq1:81-659(+)